MSFLKKNGCCTSSIAVHQAAMDRLDDLSSSPWYTNSEESEDAARVRRHIEILKATNEIDAAELLKISHSCNACNHDVRQTATQQTFAADLAEALINDTQKKLQRMQVIAARITNRNCQTQKLEHHLKTYGTILESMNLVLPDDGTGYSYKIDPIDGISLVIQRPGDSDTQTQKEARPTDLLDSDAPRTVNTPVLEATTYTAMPSPVPPPAPARASAATPTKNNTDSEKKPTINTTETRLKLTNIQIWDSKEDRNASYREHRTLSRFDPNGIPLVFKEGLCQPFDPHGDPTARSRMVIFSDLHPRTTYPEILDKVRGGAVLHITRASSTTATVSFVNCRHAHAYAKYINKAPRRLKIHGVTPRVTLVSTPSYPSPATELAHRGVTRCLEIPNAGYFSCWKLDSFFTTQKLWAFTETRDIEYVVITVEDNDQLEQDVDDEMLEDMLVEEWVAVHHNTMYRQEPKQTPRPPPTNMRVLRVSFRDVVQAERVHGLIARNFPGCGVRYIPDRCAGPLEELEG